MVNSELQVQIEKTINGLGYRLVDFQFQPRYGMVRLFIDRGDNYVAGKYFPISNTEDGNDTASPNPIFTKYPQAFVSRVSVDDCAFVSNHLSKVLMVENVNYSRLEVSSAGLDRKISSVEDFANFNKMPIKVTLKNPIINQQNHNQKHFRGYYEFTKSPNPQILINDNGQAYEFALDEIEVANLDEDEILSYWAGSSKRKAKPNLNNNSKNLPKLNNSTKPSLKNPKNTVTEKRK